MQVGAQKSQEQPSQDKEGRELGSLNQQEEPVSANIQESYSEGNLSSVCLLCSMKRWVQRMFEHFNCKKNIQPSLARPSDLGTRMSQKSLNYGLVGKEGKLSRDFQ